MVQCISTLTSIDYTFTIIATVACIISINSACFMLVALIDSLASGVGKDDESHKTTVRNLIFMLTIGDLFWSLSVAFYDILQIFIGNMGYCSFWLCVIQRALVHFFAVTTVLTTCCISIYIFLGFFQLLDAEDESSIPMFYYFFFFIIFFSLLASLSIVSFGNLKVTPSGWCEPLITSLFYNYIPIIVLFVLIAVLNLMSIMRYSFLYRAVNVQVNVSRRLLGYVDISILISNLFILIYSKF